MNQDNVSAESTIDESKESFVKKIKKSKTKIIIGGTIAGAVAVGGAIILKDRNIISTFSVEEIVESVVPIEAIHPMPEVPKAKVSRNSLICDPFTVRSHIRNLAEGRHASQEQMKLAQSLGIKLEPNQTFVRSYLKCAL